MIKSHVTYRVFEKGNWGGFHPCYDKEELKKYIAEHKDNIEQIVEVITTESDITDLMINE